MPVTLDQKTVKGIEPPAKGRRLISDQHRDAPRGFALKVWASGSKVFVLRYRVGTRDREVAIGEVGAWTLVQARQQAHEVRRQIDSGTDPLAERQRANAEPTVAQVVEEYCSRRADKQMRGRSVRSALERYLVAAHKNDKFHELRRRDVIRLVERVADDYPRQAALLLTYIKLVFAWAEDREIIEASPVATLKPQKINASMAPRARSRVLTDAEIAALWAGASASDLHRLTGIALQMILLTGQRPGEVAGMRWSEIKGNVWTIPASRRGKTQTAHTVPLTDTALDLLDEARAEINRLSRRRKADASDHVFETRPGTPITVNGIARAVKRHTDVLGNENADDEGHWRPHDLRRTCRTRLAEARIPEAVAEAVIGHTRKGIVAVYDQHAYRDEKRAALETWERKIQAIVQGEAESNVVDLMGARA